MKTAIDIVFVKDVIGNFKLTHRHYYDQSFGKKRRGRYPDDFLDCILDLYDQCGLTQKELAYELELPVNIFYLANARKNERRTEENARRL